MITNRLWLFTAIAVTFTAVGSASTIQRPGDPDIVIDPGGLSNPLSLSSNFVGGQTSNNCGTNPNGSNCFYNPFNGFITALTFEITIAPSLDFNALQMQSPPAFNCASGFFLTCSFLYNPNGTLDITFSGVLPDEGDDTGADNEANEMEGIPPLLAGCLATPDSPACGDVGHFDVNFDGWSPNGNAGLFVGGSDPSFHVQSISVNGVPVESMPEPGSGVLLGSVLLAAGMFAHYRRRRRA